MLRKALMILAIAGLAACDSTTGTGGGAPGFLAALSSPQNDAQRQARAAGAPMVWTALARGDVVVQGPRGYCVDPVTVEKRGNSGFAMIASCNILSDGATGPRVPALLVTVTVGPREDEATVPSAETIAALAGGTLQQSETRDGSVFVQLAGGGKALISDGEDRYWRAAFIRAEHLVSLAMYLPEGSHLAGSDGADFLETVVEAIKNASREKSDESSS
ncbi:hypothetical protein SAMN04488045_1006 [Thalassococcus halodurans]|uniref:Dihydroxy-acid dehydratase n=2 Tax=Thalassococcus halodurans TaxID=373675 RepID=A0A1H5UIF4_9RHOB|nr:hypothetical protein SAMN04488045_1006 [Thalassococcus halodurans]